MLARFRSADGLYGYRELPEGTNEWENVLGATGYPVHASLLKRRYVYTGVDWDTTHECMIACFKEDIPEINL